MNDQRGQRVWGCSSQTGMQGRGKGSERRGSTCSRTGPWGYRLVLPSPEQAARVQGLCRGLKLSGGWCPSQTWPRGPSEGITAGSQ